MKPTHLTFSWAFIGLQTNILVAHPIRLWDLFSCLNIMSTSTSETDPKQMQAWQARQWTCAHLEQLLQARRGTI